MIAEIISFIAGAGLASVIIGFCKAGKDNTPDHTDASMYQSCIHWQERTTNDTGNIVKDRQAGACN